MNVGYEEEELKPYIEPQPDYKDPRRTGERRDRLSEVFLSLATSPLTSPLCVSAEIMQQMGFSHEEIQDSLVNQKYNDVMAAYLLLDYRNSEVRPSSLCF